MINQKKLFIFDLDGTLIDSFIDVHNAMNQALNDCGFSSLNRDEIRQLIGPDLQFSMSNKINSSSFNYDDFIKKYRDYYVDSSTTHTRLYNKVEWVLNSLKDQDKQLAVLTNKSEDQAKLILSKLNIIHYFSFVAGPDTYNVAKPDPKGISNLCSHLNVPILDSVFIGDTEIDLLTATNVDMTSVAVTYGYRTRAELLNYSPSFIIDSLDDLLAL